MYGIILNINTKIKTITQLTKGDIDYSTTRLEISNELKKENKNYKGRGRNYL